MTIDILARIWQSVASGEDWQTGNLSYSKIISDRPCQQLRSSCHLLAEHMGIIDKLLEK